MSFNDDFHIIGDFDINIRLAAKWKAQCVQSPVAFARIHGKNLSLLHREKEINELKTWFELMKKDQFISSQNNLGSLEFFFASLSIFNPCSSVPVKNMTL